MVKVKICGITNIDDAHAAVEAGADALGFVFYAKSPRHITPEGARAIVRHLPPFISSVGVFVDEKPYVIKKTVKAAGLDVVQLHGDEPPEYCAVHDMVIKAIRVQALSDLEPLKKYSCSAYLLDSFSPDAPGGTGQVFNWDIAREARSFGRIILAGGLTPENVAEAIEHASPYGVDVSSGVEKQKGVKDHEKVRLFIQRAKAAGLKG